MNKDQTPIRGMLDRAQKSFVRSRPGSVLILVVALLVLMALIGTAYMSMAQADRATSVQHSNNNEIELLMDGLANIVKSTVSQELFYQGKYRPGQSYNQPTGTPSFQNYTGLGIDANTLANAGYTSVNAGSAYLSARVPELPGEIGGGTAALNGAADTTLNRPTWSFITAPLIGGRFSTPISATGTFLDNQTPYTYTQRSTRLEPNALVPGEMPLHPGVGAWVDPNNAANGVVAADADGDGIPDAGLIKLPMGSINGVTYYAAFRIVDGSSAVNVNTAWQHNPLTTLQGGTGPGLPGDFFANSIDLAALAAGADAGSGLTLQPILQYRFNAIGTISPNAVWSAIDDAGNTRSDFGFASSQEADWMQLGRRLYNPGIASTGGSPLKFQTFDINESISLAHNLVLRTPSAATSQLESKLYNSLVVSSDASYPIPTSAYAPGNAASWFNTNFAFLAREFGLTKTTPTPVVPLRSVLTTSNPVSNFAPNKFPDQPLTLAAYNFGDSVLYGGHRYVCIDPTKATTVLPGVVPNGQPASMLPMPGVSLAWAYDNDTWAMMPWTDSPTKISVNTGTFGQLYTSYWASMAEQSLANGSVVAPFPDQTVPGAFNARMFRSPLRLPPATPTPAGPSKLAVGLSPLQVMQLRAAIAAVNTIDLRDNDDDVTSRTVNLYDPTNVLALQTVTATVYGMEPQPFITEVYATNQQSSAATPDPGYVAIKIFNPYNFPLSLANYKLGTINRELPFIGTPPALSVTEVAAPPGFWTGVTAPIIPANSFILITSLPGNTYDAGGGQLITLPNDGGIGVGPHPQVMPAPTDGTTLLFPKIAQYVLPTLMPSALDNELVLFRPRRGNNAFYAAAGTPTAATGSPGNQPVGAFDEGDIYDMVPVDSYDFTGLKKIVDPATEKAVEWHYIRPSDAEAGVSSDPLTSWHWVYPGHYVIAPPYVGAPVQQPPAPDVIDLSSLSGFPRFIDGTYRGKFPGGSFATPTVLKTVPAGLVTIPPAATELWTMSQYFTPSQMYAVAVPYRDIPLRINAVDSAGPNNIFRVSRASSTNVAEPFGYPYGGFARNGDILQVPYIGAYRLTLPGQIVLKQFLEMNSVSMDSVMALAAAQYAWNETTPAADETTGNCDPLTLRVTPPDAVPGETVAYENVGRFCPLGLVSPLDGASTSATLGTIDDFGPVASNYRYHFATRVLDYLTVQSPQQDYLPNVDPAASDQVVLENPKLEYKYPGTDLLHKTWVPTAVANSLSTKTLNGEFTNPGNATEQTAGIQGLININTAPWRVLATVPWMPPDPTNNAQDNGPKTLNAAIAMSIIYYRDVNNGVNGRPHGPFKSIFELNNVPIYCSVSFDVAAAPPPGTMFKDLLRIAPYNGYTDLNKGDLQAAYAKTSAPGQDPTRGDFMSQYLMINRVSSLLTTRSDYFTAYILLQGWKDAETPNATMVVQRRAAYLIDRTGIVGASNATPAMTYFPNN